MKTLHEVTKFLGIRKKYAETEVYDLEIDSRKVKSGSIFIALIFTFRSLSFFSILRLLITSCTDTTVVAPIIVQTINSPINFFIKILL